MILLFLHLKLQRGLILFVNSLQHTSTLLINLIANVFVELASLDTQVLPQTKFNRGIYHC